MISLAYSNRYHSQIPSSRKIIQNNMNNTHLVLEGRALEKGLFCRSPLYGRKIKKVTTVQRTPRNYSNRKANREAHVPKE